ncbi:AraC family transcriptional regulator N-terminal domain-containing protein [Dactylosporangium sucinum]|uniref:AraC family transcriptional regulator n=1 Tax=Dactylosporangium sucinum TaxID=1424081 RepID=A0A917X5B3_9ACTN|nr:AraC family transcriptional regulator [Dactylosporangium sucinum]GGM68401.1 AraC family transcriptional regulator [Dactylosporangium sucinum]
MVLDELSSLLARHARPDLTTAIDNLLIIRADRPYPPKPVVYGRVLAVVTQGTKCLAFGDRVYEYRAGQYVVASVDLPVSSHFTEATPASPGLGVGLNLDPADVAELLLQVGPGDLPAIGTDAPAGLAVSDASTELLDALLRLVRLLDRPRDIPVLAPMAKREILWRLVTGEQGPAVRQLGLPDSSLSHVARAVRWIHANYTRRFLVEDLARIAGMSVSAFHRNFQAVTAMSPIQFQKQIRLQQARLQLAAQTGDVTAVSRRVGYDSPSQFSREYRRQFGVPPSRDAAQLRTADLSAS